jgi:hypothetical protein
MPDIRSDGLGLDGFESHGFLLVRAYIPSCPSALGYSLRRISRSRVDRRTDPVSLDPRRFERYQATLKFFFAS